MNAIPPMPHATVDTRLDAPQALMLAEEAIGKPTPLMSTFGLSKVAGEVTGRHPTGFTYKTSIIPFMKMKMNEGYVVAQDNGQGGTRISFHESKRSTMIFGIMLGVIVAFEILFYFLVVHQSAPTPMGYGYGGMGYPMQPAASSGFPLWLFIILFIALAGVTAFQMFEVVTSPKKVVQYFSMRANGGMPAPQAGFPGQAAGGFPPHTGGFPPPQPGGFPPQPQQAGFPPAQPAGFPPQPNPAFPPAAAPPVAPPSVSDADEKLRQLAELRDSGIITAEDYNKAAAAIEAKR